jgi:uncharacterized protein YcgI (DUF1989 family)
MPTRPDFLVESLTIEPDSGGSGVVKKGQTLRVTDIEGQQVGCFLSVTEEDPMEYTDCIYTNWRNGRYKWREGDFVYSNHMNPLWFIADDKTANHYTGGGFCSRDAFQHYCDSDQPGCREILQSEYRKLGMDPNLLQSVSCIGLFMNVEYAPSGEWLVSEPITKSGDYIELCAATNLIWMTSVCGWPKVINGEKPTPLRFELYGSTR